MATYPPTKSSAIGSMELGSVPSPPRNPRSSTSTQSARQSTSEGNQTAQDQAPASAEEEDPRSSPGTSTANRLTAQPCARTKEANDASHEERNEGWGVCAMVRTMPCQCPAVALPVAPTGPCLQDRHADEEHTG